MTATNHALTGALIATAIDKPLLAVPIAFASHFVLDALPHFGVSKNLKTRNSSSLFRTVTTLDLVICAALFLIAPWVAQSLDMNIWIMWACMFAAICPDLVWGYRLYRELTEKLPISKSKFSKFHSKIQWGERPRGLYIELLWGAAVSITIIAPLL
jgi:hypothetical protein